MIEKVLFWSKVLEIEFLIKHHVLRFPESKNHIFSGWSVCLSANLLSEQLKKK